jgi:lysozyme
MSFYGDNINRFFFGIVVNNNDFLNLGRVQIRVFGVHGDNIQNYELPFAQVLMPSTEPGIGGAGTPRLIGIGAQVFGVFLDGKDSQTPLVLGTIPKIMIPSETRLGSTDGDNAPLSYPSESEVGLPSGTTEAAAARVGSPIDIDTSDLPSDVIELIAGFEGYGVQLPDGRCRAYWDYAQYSIGFGTRATGENEILTREQAEARLAEEVAGFREGVISRSQRWGYTWSENQINALTSFSYNLGLGALGQLTANGSRSNTEIATKMLLYVNAGGERLPGLVNRRAREQALFLRA